jgi:hypothetical protein
MNIADAAQEEKITRSLVDAAMWAPSLHDTQPWRFETGGSSVTMHAESDRRLETVDPCGREMLISCGAALYNLRLAVCHLGRRPDVRTFPDPGRPGLIADVRIGPPHATTPEERQLYRQITRRRGHRGGFRPGCLPAGLLQALRGQAYAEQVSLRILADPRARTALAALTEAAEQIQRQDPAYVTEVGRWVPPPGDERRNGVQDDARTAQSDPDLAEPDAMGGREAATGIVALLVTDRDERADWLRAGQALQRILLCAAERDVSAAFHTQAIEVPELRELVRVRFADGAHPQVIMRLGVPPLATGSVRRSVTDLTRGAL